MQTSMTKRIITSAVILSGVVILSLSCGPNQRILESANENHAATGEAAATNANVAPAASSFEQDLNAMRTADFKFILAIRRKDGQSLDAADRELISKEGAAANRRRLSDGGKAVLIGSNFPFITGTFDSLKGRFSIEDYSKPDSGSMFSDSVPNR